jgi:plasmid stabilization system protein ParE
MKFRVVITANAKSNLREYYERAAKHAPETAANWLNRFHDALQTLVSHPERCSLAAESALVEQEVRQFNFGKRVGTYRALFTIADDEVRILHIRRAAMGTAPASEVEA